MRVETKKTVKDLDKKLRGRFSNKNR